MKFCVDCKHYKRYESERYYLALLPVRHLCLRSCKPNIVTGDLEPDGKLDCKVEREDAMRLEHFRCGVDGKYYEPKEKAE